MCVVRLPYYKASAAIVQNIAYVILALNIGT